MAENYMERIEALRQQYLATRVDMDVYNAKYVTEGFRDTEGLPWMIQKATGYKYECERKQIYIQAHELLVGGVGFKPRCGILNPDSASGVIEREVDTISTRPFDPFYLSDEGKQVYLNDVKDYWKNKCVLDRWNLMLPDDVKRLRTNGAIFIDRKAVRGYGETTVDWRMIVNKGIGALKKEAEEALAKRDQKERKPKRLAELRKYWSEELVSQVADGSFSLNRYIPDEWAYSDGKDSELNQISQRLYDQEETLSNAPDDVYDEVHEQFQEQLLETVTLVFETLRTEGVFGPEVLCFVSMSDDERTPEIEDASAQRLNTPEQYEQFQNWTAFFNE